MSVSKAIRKLLKQANKSYLDLVPLLNNSPQYVNVKINRGPFDSELINAIARVTNVKDEKIIEIIDEARRKEQKEVSADGKIKELEEKNKTYELTIKLLSEKVTVTEQLKESQASIIEMLKKSLIDKEKELERAIKFIDLLEEKIKKG